MVYVPGHVALPNRVDGVTPLPLVLVKAEHVAPPAVVLLLPLVRHLLAHYFPNVLDHHRALWYLLLRKEPDPVYFAGSQVQAFLVQYFLKRLN